MVHVAVLGAGVGLGKQVIDSLLERSHTVAVLSRKDHSSSDINKPSNLKYTRINYDDHQSLVSALQSVHTVISTTGALGKPMYDTQIAVLNAAIEAGVKRFIPSEFAGQEQVNEETGVYNYKTKFFEKLSDQISSYPIFWFPFLKINNSCTKFSYVF